MAEVDGNYPASSFTCTWVKEPNLVRVIPEEAAPYRRRLFFASMNKTLSGEWSECSAPR